jgi:hypothetical protein
VASIGQWLGGVLYKKQCGLWFSGVSFRHSYIVVKTRLFPHQNDVSSGFLNAMLRPGSADFVTMLKRPLNLV